MLRGQHPAQAVAASQFTHRDLAGHLLAAPARQQLAQALAGTIAAAQDALPPGRRLRLLEIGAHAPWFGPDCCAALDFRRADFSLCGRGRRRPRSRRRQAGRASRRLGAPDRGSGRGRPRGGLGGGPRGRAMQLFPALADARAALHDARAPRAGRRAGAGGAPPALGPTSRSARWPRGGSTPWTAAEAFHAAGRRPSGARALQALGLRLRGAAGTGARRHGGRLRCPALARAGELPETAPAEPPPSLSAERFGCCWRTRPARRQDWPRRRARALRASGLRRHPVPLDAEAGADTLPALALSGAYEHVIHAAGLYSDEDGAAAHRCALAASALRACERHGRPVAHAVAAHGGSPRSRRHAGGRRPRHRRRGPGRLWPQPDE